MDMMNNRGYASGGAYFQRLLSKTRAAVDRYDMISPRQKIAVGVSGGKDSLVLLNLMAALRRFHPSDFDLVAISLDPCFGGVQSDYSPIEEMCAELDVPFAVRRSRLGQLVFEERKEQNPCALCARIRRGILHNMALEQGCTGLALGHHLDDAAATFWMNLTSGGRVSCFSPVTYLDRKQIYMIRPMIFCREQEIIAASERMNLPVMKSRCRADGCTQRRKASDMLRELEETYPHLTEQIIRAMQRDGISGWGDKLGKQGELGD